MANELTGDFDVVAEFSIAAANRVLAAMHASERFPHSMTLRVDDNPPPGPKAPGPSIVGAVDAFGEPTVNHDHIGAPIPLPGRVSAADPTFWALDPVVNSDAGAFITHPVPSKLQGRAQLQVFAPTIEVPDNSGKNLRVRLGMMSRYLPDPNTDSLAEFVRGELQLTAAVNQATSQAASVVAIDIKADDVSVNFVPSSSSQPLSAANLAAVHLLIRNALKTSFLPSNITVPPDRKMQFKTLLGPPGAVAVVLNMTEGSAAGNPASMGNVFLAAGDAFAFAVGIDYLQSVLSAKMLANPIPPIPYHNPVLGSTTYHVSLSGVSVALPGKIVVTITGHATNDKWQFPNFNFTATLDFTLKTTGITADLTPGNVSVDTDSTVVNAVGKGDIENGIRDARNAALSTVGPDGLDTYGTVNRMLSTDDNLGQFLALLLKPPRQPAGAPPLPELKPILAYTSVEYRASGIVLHGGWMTIPYPPAAHVEFEEIPSTDGAGQLGGAIFRGPDYSALKTWIPGGTIDRYEWSYLGETQVFVEPNKFVLQDAGPQAGGATASMIAASGYTTRCLTVRGRRLSWSGPVVDQPESVSATVCDWAVFPVISVGVRSALGDATPMVALSRPSSRGVIEVVGHTPARPREAGVSPPNLIVHFADDRTAGQLEALTLALRDSRRDDAATAVVAVLTDEQLAGARHLDGVIYAEEQHGVWGRAFGLKTTRRPLTLIVRPNGSPVWEHEGEIDRGALAAALRKNLAPGGLARPHILRLSLRLGSPAPNFLFEYAPGRALTLRKLAGRPATLVFWRSSSKASIEAVRDLQNTSRQTGGPVAVVLALNDGDAIESARRVAAQNGLEAILVPDPDRKISLAYDVNIWPTIVSIDALGLVREIRYGRDSGVAR